MWGLAAVQGGEDCGVFFVFVFFLIISLTICIFPTFNKGELIHAEKPRTLANRLMRELFDYFP
uniref:Uncharacterized protein n=1 Tax=Cercocebus atys TaxID=9531 RepID=A0A2K5L556_CERAT